MRIFNRKIHKSVAQDCVVEVTECDGVRYLHLESNTVQSAMQVSQPNMLTLNYSRAILYFLLFSDQVKTVLTIGLGGGSVTKYIHAYCPQIEQTVLEVNPEVIRVARSHFYVPDNDARLNIIRGDGIAYMHDHANSSDCLIIDAFDAYGLPPDFCTQAFFDTCFAVLQTHGILVVNLWGSDKHFDTYLQRMELSFNGRVLMVRTGKPGNIIVFCFKDPQKLSEKKLRERARLLAQTHAISFTEFLDQLHADNGNQALYTVLESK